jgi:hypothetical protein
MTNFLACIAFYTNFNGGQMGRGGYGVREKIGVTFRGCVLSVKKQQWFFLGKNHRVHTEWQRPLSGIFHPDGKIRR